MVNDPFRLLLPLKRNRGYVLIILMMAVFVLTLGLMIAAPIWQTEIQREKEEELIFRGKQYVEAVRLYLLKNPGKYPSSLKELKESTFIRRLYKDPMTDGGEWNVVLNPGNAGASRDKQRIMIAPESLLSSIPHPMILGVVSSSTKKSVMLYEKKASYDKWFFFYGHDPQKPPEVIVYGHDNDEDADVEDEEEF